MKRQATMTGRPAAGRRIRRASGFTLIEIAIVLTIIGVVTAIAVPSVDRYFEGINGGAAARSVANAFAHARAQAIRTGSNHVVFFAIGGAGDTAGNDLERPDGGAVPILVLNDGAPGSANQNCEIDASEDTVTFNAQDGVGWGFNGPDRLRYAARRGAREHSGGGLESDASDRRGDDLGPVPTRRHPGRDRRRLQRRPARLRRRHDLSLDPESRLRDHAVASRRRARPYVEPQRWSVDVVSRWSDPKSERSSRSDSERRSVDVVSKRRNQRGLTLVEMMIAMVVLSIGLLGVAGLQARAILEGSGGRHLSEASAMARNRVEELNRLAWDASALDDSGGVFAATNTIDGLDGITYTVSDRISWDDPNVATVQLKSIEVQVGWNDEKRQNRQVVLTSARLREVDE